MTIQQKPSLAEFLQWPEQKPYLEFIHGMVRRKTMGNDVHSFLQTEFAVRLRAWRPVTEGFTLTEQRCILRAYGEDHVVLPDVAWFSRSQLPVLVGGPVRVAPGLAIEILSPDDRFRDVQEKILIYLAAGVSVLWVVDPENRTVTVYRPGGSPELVVASDTLQDPALPGLSISMPELFALLPPESREQP